MSTRITQNFPINNNGILGGGNIVVTSNPNFTYYNQATPLLLFNTFFYSSRCVREYIIRIIFNKFTEQDNIRCNIIPLLSVAKHANILQTSKSADANILKIQIGSDTLPASYLSYFLARLAPKEYVNFIRKIQTQVICNRVVHLGAFNTLL